MEAILDSSFIISCIKRKIDFVSALEEMGFKVLLPKEVFQELKDLRLKVRASDRAAIDMAFDIFNTIKIKKTSLGNNSVDRGLISIGKKGAYIATLDSGIKREVPNKIVIRESQNSIEIERD
jgi:rRNA-processing protein FCF1